ncbi:hypothetical protein EIN_378170 [Entamoeba invadens IP1]|uniref:Auto-transporter adhesin head GIN domain-containing protein n=1 Tax=Entamoeba invadens IP1 TaxID=370355 RepID=A0A0A1TU84_ENTIV|nr:hypothetical protein EIN_378170 [Entamoeba invadens IP1]ELP83522.1 hypothetical protein EIN_378170 [Entamoeba invadens IP1]|eukprot:XP_004182868.1 hypothetical protein EIN_378170 [Entamoeba invadens IP1]
MIILLLVITVSLSEECLCTLLIPQMSTLNSYSCPDVSKCTIEIPADIHEVFDVPSNIPLIINTESLTMKISKDTNIPLLTLVTSFSIRENQISVYPEDGSDNPKFVVNEMNVIENQMDFVDHRVIHKMSMFTNSTFHTSNEKVEIEFYPETVSSLESMTEQPLRFFKISNYGSLSLKNAEISFLKENSGSVIHAESSKFDVVVLESSEPKLFCTKCTIRAFHVVGDYEDIRLYILTNDETPMVEKLDVIEFENENSYKIGKKSEWSSHKDLRVSCNPKEVHLVEKGGLSVCQPRVCSDTVDNWKATCLVDETVSNTEITNSVLILSHSETYNNEMIPRKVTEIIVDADTDNVITLKALSFSKLSVLKGSCAVENCVIPNVELAESTTSKISFTNIEKILIRRNANVTLSSCSFGSLFDATGATVTFLGTSSIASIKKSRVILSNNRITFADDAQLLSKTPSDAFLDQNEVSIATIKNPVWEAKETTVVLMRSNTITRLHKEGCQLFIATNSEHQIAFDGEEENEEGIKTDNMILDQMSSAVYLCGENDNHLTENNLYNLMTEVNTFFWRQQREVKTYIECKVPKGIDHNYDLKATNCLCDFSSTCAFVFEDDDVHIKVPQFTRTLGIIMAKNLTIEKSDEDVEIGGIVMESGLFDSTVRVNVLVNEKGKLVIRGREVEISLYLGLGNGNKTVSLEDNSSVVIGGILHNVVIIVSNGSSLELEGTYSETKVESSEIYLSSNSMMFCMENDFVRFSKSKIVIEHTNQHAIAISSHVSFDKESSVVFKMTNKKLDKKYMYVFFSSNGYNEEMVDTIQLKYNTRTIEKELTNECGGVFKMANVKLTAPKCLKSPFNLFGSMMNEPVNWRKHSKRDSSIFSVVFVLMGFLALTVVVFIVKGSISAKTKKNVLVE